MNTETPLFKAVKENNLDLIIQHAPQYAGMRDKEGYTALHRAILSRKLECTVILAPYERRHLTSAGISPAFLAESTGFLQAIGCLQDPPQEASSIREEDGDALGSQESTILDNQLELLKELIDTRAELDLARSWIDELQRNLIEKNTMCSDNGDIPVSTLERSYTNIDICAICLDRPRGVVYLPCRHFITCERCFNMSRLRSCPLCRSPIIDTVVVLR